MVLNRKGERGAAFLSLLSCPVSNPISCACTGFAKSLVESKFFLKAVKRSSCACMYVFVLLLTGAPVGGGGAWQSSYVCVFVCVLSLTGASVGSGHAYQSQRSRVSAFVCVCVCSHTQEHLLGVVMQITHIIHG